MLIYTYNGKEFIITLISNYWENNDIIIIHGRPYHSQSQGWVGSFNKEIKRLLLNLFLGKIIFFLELFLLDGLNIYNRNKHSITKVSPIDLFNKQDKDMIKRAFDNIKK